MPLSRHGAPDPPGSIAIFVVGFDPITSGGIKIASDFRKRFPIRVVPIHRTRLKIIGVGLLLGRQKWHQSISVSVGAFARSESGWTEFVSDLRGQIYLHITMADRNRLRFLEAVAQHGGPNPLGSSRIIGVDLLHDARDDRVPGADSPSLVVSIHPRSIPISGVGYATISPGQTAITSDYLSHFSEHGRPDPSGSTQDIGAACFMIVAGGFPLIQGPTAIVSDFRSLFRTIVSRIHRARLPQDRQERTRLPPLVGDSFPS